MRRLLTGLQFILCAVEWCLIAAAAALLVLLLLGLHPYAVRTGSMEPAISAGSVCFVNRRAAFSDVQKDDIIAFKAGEMLVMHRAVQIDAQSILTQGDANNAPDSMRVTQEDFVGTTVFWIPYLGRFLLYLRTWHGKAVFAAALALLLFTVTMLERQNQKEDVHPERHGMV